MNPNEEFVTRPAAALLKARSVAMIGASPKGRWPALIFRNLKEGRYPGNIYLVNPNYKELWEQPCYPNLKALPEPPEHILVLVPTRAVMGTLEEAAALGTKAATIYSSGFGEGEDPRSKERGRALQEFSERSGLVCCGPNCMGTVSVREGQWCFPTLFPNLRHGPVGLIFQSGGSLGAWLRAAGERGVGFSYAISSGNEVSLDTVDYLKFLLDDEATKLIGLMIEGIRRPGALMSLAAEALRRGKPILVVKLGRSEGGKRQAISHTGALAGADDVFDAVCRRYGLVRCPSLEDLLETTLAFVPGKIPRGNRTSLVVNSGGMKGLLMDDVEEAGTVLSQWSEATRAAIRPLIPEDLAVENPLECGVAGFGDEENYMTIIRRIAADESVDLIAIHGELPRPPDKRTPENYAALAASIAQPLIAFARVTHNLTDESRAFQDAAGMPFLQGIKPTLRALKALCFYGARQPQAAKLQPLPEPSGKPSDLEAGSLEKILQAIGVTPPRQARASSAAEAARKADEIGYPVALKLEAEGVVHKTEAGGVALNLGSAAEVLGRAEEMLRRHERATLLVQEMVQGTEVILGARSDPQYGPFIMLGMGGIFVEILNDKAMRLLPVDEDQAFEMLRELRGYRMLEGARGRPKSDIPALVRAIAGLSNLYLNYRSFLSDLEVNPLMVREEGKGVAAVDVRVVRKPNG
ncbi:MAG TPA: acetate--CoA ligase family protein [Candidatus Acidoferrales bacterium]|nr:acetate--CoA ligase family protein [Candidatus Acidoferrales bacterium]